MTLKELLAKRDALAEHGDRLGGALEAYRGIDTFVGKEFARAMQGDLRLLGDAVQQKAKEKLKAEAVKSRKPALAVALFEVTKAREALRSELRSFETEAGRPPTAEEAFRRRAHEAGVSAERLLQIGILDRLTRAELREETATWTPAQWRDRYRVACGDPLEQENACFIRFCEERHGAGYRGYVPDVDAATHATIGNELWQRDIETARRARVPRDVADVRTVIDQLGKVIEKAKYHVDAINPELDPTAAAAAAESAA